MENSYTIDFANNKRRRIGDLKDRVSAVSSENLITENEKKIIESKRGKKTESEIFRLLMEKDIDSSVRILEILKNAKSTMSSIAVGGNAQHSLSNMKHSFRPTDNPLKIAMILQTIFSFLDLSNIKNCRLVCHEWNELAESFVRKLAMISLGYPSDNACFLKSMSYFKYIFNFHDQAIPFTALRLKNFNENSEAWPSSVVKEIFREWGNCLKEVTIDRIQIQNTACFKLSKLFKNTNITKLNVQCAVKVSLVHIPQIKYLNLYGCELVIPKGVKICPIDIRLQGCKIIFEDPLDLKSVNEFIDLKGTKSLVMKNQFTPWQENIKLDFKGNFELDCVDLENVSVVNWSISNWVIKMFILPCHEIKEKSKIQIWEMTVTDSLECLSLIPESVKKLFWYAKRFAAPISLPNLEHLVFHGDSFEMLFFFQKCKNLTTLNIQPFTVMPYFLYDNRAMSAKIPFQWIFNIKNLSIGRIIKITGNGIITLRKLVLLSYPFTDCKKLLSKVKVKHLVISLTPYEERNFEGGIFQFLKSSDNTIAIGPFNWEKADFPKTRLSRLVDRQSEYYMFENKIGRAIPEIEFYKMSTL